jgi:hypothetical protein
MLVRMKSRRASSQMPPLGTVLRDEETIAAVMKWIARWAHLGHVHEGRRRQRMQYEATEETVVNEDQFRFR